jgi:hypothetical protein
MTLQRFIAVAFVVFVAGVMVLYSGLNRAPFRQNNHGPGHQQGHSSLTTRQPVAVQPAGWPAGQVIWDAKGGRQG